MRGLRGEKQLLVGTQKVSAPKSVQLERKIVAATAARLTCASTVRIATADKRASDAVDSI